MKKISKLLLLLPLLAFFVACEYGIDITPAGSILPNTLTVRAARVIIRVRAGLRPE